MDQYKQLLASLSNLGKVAVAFSGGVDSTLLATAAQQALGKNAVALTAQVAMHPEWERAEALEFAHSIGIRHLLIEIDAFAVDGFAQNLPDRCYTCKKALFSRLKAVAEAEGAVLCDGTNADDANDYRPGGRAVAELGIISPLRDCGMTKADVRRISAELGLPTAQKPAYACLASRIPYYDTITPEKLRRVEAGENVLRALNFSQVRLRHHGDIARLEVIPEEMDALWAQRDVVAKALREAGYAYVCADLEGYRMGSMNETLKSAKE